SPIMTKASSVRVKLFLVCTCLATFAASAEQFQIIGWGSNDYGETDAPADLTNAVAICAGINNNAVLSTGGVHGWGGNGDTVPPTLTGVQQLSSRYAHGLALFSNGTVTAWGRNYAGGLDVPAGLNNVVAVA